MRLREVNTRKGPRSLWRYINIPLLFSRRPTQKFSLNGFNKDYESKKSGSSSSAPAAATPATPETATKKKKKKKKKRKSEAGGKICRNSLFGS